MSASKTDAPHSVSIVTQTCVRPERADDFARWQGETSSLIQHFPGFIEQRLLPPAPPLQVDWVILQRFASLADAQRWLGSPERQSRIAGAAPMLVGRDDVHIVQDEASGIKPAPVSAIISTRVKPGHEEAYRAWERKIAAAQSKAPRPPGLPLRTTRTGCPGGLRRHPAVRHRGQPSGLARLARSQGAGRGSRPAHRGVPFPHRKLRVRAMVQGRRRRRRPARLEDEHARPPDALPGRHGVRVLRRHPPSSTGCSICPSPSRCSWETW